MDSTTLLLLVVPLMLGLVFNAMRFMRFVGFLAGAPRKLNSAMARGEDRLSFDQRVAERLRDLDRETRDKNSLSVERPATPEFGRRQT